MVNQESDSDTIPTSATHNLNNPPDVVSTIIHSSLDKLVVLRRLKVGADRVDCRSHTKPNIIANSLSED
jgi:hypothetical protein